MKREDRLLARATSAAAVLLGLTIGNLDDAWAQDAPAAPPAPVMAPAYPAPALPPAVFYSPRLQASFDMVPYGSGLAARLRPSPAATSPLRQSQIQLEPGDTITALDDYPFSGPDMFETHHSQTKVTFINVRTNQLEARWVYLPPPGPGPGPGPYVLGVNGVSAQVYKGGFLHAGLRITQVTPGSAAAFAGLRPGMTILTAGPYATPDIGSLRAAIAQSEGTLAMTVQDATQRFTRNYTAHMGGGGGAAAVYAPGQP